MSASFNQVASILPPPRQSSDLTRLFTPPQMADVLASQARTIRLQREELIELRSLRNERPVATPGETDQESRLRIRCGFEILENPVNSRWLHRPYLEESILALLYGDLGTFKSFLALLWALTLAGAGTPTLYLSAEGRGLERRIRGWCLRHDPSRKPEQVMMGLPFYAIEQAFALPVTEELATLERAIESQAVPPKLIVVDTLNRYGGILDENRAADVAAFVTACDQIRLKYGATILIVHHVGHQVKDRARGSYALMAATDAHFLVERPDPAKLLIRVTTGRLKDCESPAPLVLEAEVVDLGDVDEDGQPRTTLVLRPTDQIVEHAPRKPTGKRQGELLRQLEKEYEAGTRVWTDCEVRRMARERFDMHRNSARDAILGLHQAGYLRNETGGMTLVHPPGSVMHERTKTHEPCRSGQVNVHETHESPLGLVHSCAPPSNCSGHPDAPQQALQQTDTSEQGGMRRG